MVMRVDSQTIEERLNDMYHPTSALYIVKYFFKEVYYPLSTLLKIKDIAILTSIASLPREKDLKEAYLSLVRTQAVYNFKSVDLYNGRVMNRTGHKLTIYDALKIASLTPDEHIPIGLSWINVALSDRKTNGTSVLDFDIYVTASNLYFRAHRFKDGVRYLEKAAQIDAFDKEVLDLLNLKNSFSLEDIPIPANHSSNYIQSCIQSTMVLDNKWYHVCRYVKNYLPYVLYREEILHWNPYISVFYDVTNDETLQTLQNFSVEKLDKSLVQGFVEDFGRSSSNTFLEDSISPLLHSLSQKIGEITHLNTQQDVHATSSGEPYQVVNYGLGGEYRPHVDASPDLTDMTVGHLQQSGDRLATFLIYLSNVEYGGATVFPKLGIKMQPIKNSAIFWYNYPPHADEVDYDSMHGGCPVVFGEKWVANKWVWFYGNTFTRPCGLTREHTELQLQCENRRAPSQFNCTRTR